MTFYGIHYFIHNKLFSIRYNESRAASQFFGCTFAIDERFPSEADVFAETLNTRGALEGITKSQANVTKPWIEVAFASKITLIRAELTNFKDEEDQKFQDIELRAGFIKLIK